MKHVAVKEYKCFKFYYSTLQKQPTNSLIAGLRKTNEQAVDSMSNEKVDKEKQETEAQVRYYIR